LGGHLYDKQALLGFEPAEHHDSIAAAGYFSDDG
jgi:hypothetical protein